jgi:amino acid adenylation domain-containing protein
VKETALAAYAHQDIPFEKLVEELRPERSLSHNPIFQVMFAHQAAPMTALELPGLRLERVTQHAGTALFDMLWFAIEVPEGLLLRVEYSTDLFDEATIDRALGHFQKLLEAAVAHPEHRISRLPLLTEHERHTILREFNATDVEFPALCLHSFVELSAARVPYATALICGSERTSYRELNERANQIAHHLTGLGAGPGVLVGVFMERSSNLIAALLGVLKAGAAYVPLDPIYPRQRLLAILQDAKAPFVLTQASLIDQLPLGELPETQAKFLALDSEWNKIAKESRENPASKVRPEDLAYVLFTSGSTGRPKGVAIEHHSASTLIQWAQTVFTAAELAGTLLSTSVCFDLSIFEMFAPLSVGEKIIIVQNALFLPAAEAKDEVTLINTVPSAMAELVRMQAVPESVVTVNLAGEALAAALVSEVYAATSTKKLYNLYGPTEDTTYSTYTLVRPDSRVTIGRPLPNSQAYVLDRYMNPAPIGVPGELYLAGDGLARGYYGRPDLTAERFVANPFAARQGARMYKTGDLCRWRLDGDLEYLGRMDHQIKLRGFRIELGEIEAVLTEHKGVKQAIVLAREDQPGNPQLVAYVVAETDAVPAEGSAEAVPEAIVKQWESVWDEAYKPAVARADRFNITGWNSSYSGEPIPAEEMREWVECTVERIRGLRPKRILEIGCGTGLLLFRLLEHSEHYHGIDLSQGALDSIRKQLTREEQKVVSLSHGGAHDLSMIPPRSFDTVIINSVAQYFPGIEYLRQVIEAAMEKTADGGTIFVGDIRSLPLLKAFHAAVQLEQSPPSLGTTQWLERVRRQVAQEEELVVDPDFFRALQAVNPRMAEAEILLKRGKFHNEMSQFRYDVLLRVGQEAAKAANPAWLNWQRDGLTVEAVRQRLRNENPEVLAIEGIPNARFFESVAALRLAMEAEPPGNLGELRQAARQAGALGAADPYEFWRMESSLEFPYAVSLTWSDDYRFFDAVLQRKGVAGGVPLRHRRASFSHNWETYANDPATGAVMRNLVPELRGWLNERVAEYMVPSGFVVLDSFPLTPNGKIDRKALPAPEFTRPETGAYVAPRNSIEETVAAIWSEVLHVPRIGATDDFFALGGHSLLATQVISRLRQAFGIDLPLRVMFEAPRLDALATRIQTAKRGLEIPPIVHVSREKPLPASFAQQRLWFLDQLEPNSPAFNIAHTLKITGAVDGAALEKSLNLMAARHESLRTSFGTEAEEPVQIIHASVRVPFRKVDLSGVAANIRETEAQRLIAKDANRPFDLTQAPLIRALLLRLSDDEHYLLINIHHIVSDRWSISILVSELARLYEAEVDGKEAENLALPLQYADYAVWQRKWLSGDLLQEQLGYWKEHLKNAPQVLELPHDRPRPASESFRGEIAYVSFPRELKDKLNRLSRKQGATLFMTLLAGFEALLSRSSGQRDLVVGTAIANRNQPELENVIGFFLNTLPLRANLAGDPSFTEILARAKETALGAYEHQDLPFEKLVEELRPERSLSHSPLIQVYFVLQNAPVESVQLNVLQWKHVPSGLKTVKGDMYLSMHESAEGIEGRLEYSSDLFDAGTMERMLEHFRVLLEAAVGNPECKLSQLPLLTEREREQIVVEWNATEADYPRGLCLHEVIELRAAESPQAVACMQPGEGENHDRQITYGELNQRANQLARALRKRGAGPGQRVGIFIERSIEMMVGLLAIQKSGAAYVPLDPAYPAERIRLTLEDAQVPVLVTQQSLRERLPDHDAQVLCIDSDWETIAGESATNLGKTATPEDIAYVIFTSGSTGRPKGVQIPHRAVVNLLTFMARELRMGADDVFPALASFAFDMCIPELYLALVSGGRVVIGGKDLAANGEELAALLRQTGATIVHATPTTWRLLLEAGFNGKGLKRVIGAEPLPRELCMRLLTEDPSLYNFYGPTETTVWSTYHHFTSPDEPVVVGKPIANTQVYILDENLQPVPVGAYGEIYIGGDGVARGYLNRPDLTAEKFVDDPFSAAAEQKMYRMMYRTGDVARFLADGRIEFQGRADHQVKLRGYRIELEEIEAALGAHSAIKQSVVIAREDVAGDKRLVAYVVAKSDQPVSTAELRDWVHARLPEYMVPAAWVQMDRLPLSPNGKVDRKNLPAPEYLRPELQGEYSTPRTPEEEVVAGIWAEVLKFQQVGIHDDFFALGGHSLLATQVVSRIRQAFKIELPLRALFEAPTVAGLAERIAALAKKQAGIKAAPPMRRVSREKPLPLSFAQQRLWFLDQMEPGNPLYNVAYVTRMSGPVLAQALEDSLNEIVRRHESLRTTFQSLDDQPVQVIAPTLLLKLRVLDASHLPTPEERETEARRLATAEIQQPFDLAAGPLLRPSLIRIGDDDHALILNTHHIISDRWSLGVLTQELAELYVANLQGHASPLAELEIQYADYAVWQREFLSGEVLDKQIAYWRQKLEGAPPVLELPTDRARKGTEQFWGAQHRQPIPAELTHALKALSRSQRGTFFMALLAGFQLLMSRLAGQDDVVLGTDLANRNQLETEKLIGFFVNLLPIRARVNPEGSFNEFFQQVRENSLEIMAHQDVPFDKLVEELRPERSLTHNPLVQVLFVMQNTPQMVEEFGGLKLRPLGVGGSSRFDLVIFINNPETDPSTMWVYNPNLFDASTIARMANTYQLLLQKVCADPEMKLGTVFASLDEADKQQRGSEQKTFQEAGLAKLKKARRKVIAEV